MIDQRKLPLVESWIELETPEAVADAIRKMVVRGAPAIGISAAFGLALGATRSVGASPVEFDARMNQLYTLMNETRPTAVNLPWAIERMRRLALSSREAGLDNAGIAARLEEEAARIHAEDLAACRAIGGHGATLLPSRASVLTHCNAGGLATAGYGTALGVIRSAVEAGKKIHVLADETRPFLQGSRLTAWELMRDNIETTLITDNMAGSLMQAGEVDLVVVGADRVAINGDVANKIGTDSVAVLARENEIPFYVAIPTSTIDPDCPDGAGIPIEERPASEVTELFGVRIAPAGVKVRNPAFDITPARYVRAIITENGIATPPYEKSLRQMLKGGGE